MARGAGGTAGRTAMCARRRLGEAKPDVQGVTMVSPGMDILGPLAWGGTELPHGKQWLQKWLPMQVTSQCARGSWPSSPSR